MTATPIRTTVLNPGQCRARALVLDEPLSFWGGFDPVRGVIVDRHHPQRGACLASKILVMPGSRDPLEHLRVIVGQQYADSLHEILLWETVPLQTCP